MKKYSTYYFRTVLLTLFLTLSLSTATQAQRSLLDVPTFEKLSYSLLQDSSRYFNTLNWTGQGLQNKVTIDDIPTMELRARLQALFGDPTKTVRDVYQEGKFGQSAGATIQFEYILVVDGKIPLTIMDTNGPFTTGLTYGGASRYIDLYPQIKRTLSEKLMEVDTLASFSDLFYRPEKDQWYEVSYRNGEFLREKIDSPRGIRYNGR
mgnify:CR=1 FL=1